MIMVTKDTTNSAEAIARKCNIIWDKTANDLAEVMDISFEDAVKKSNSLVIHGDRLTKINDKS